MLGWKRGSESCTRVARLLLYLAIVCRDDMYGHGRDGSKLTREVLPTRFMGRLPWLHLLHLVFHVGQCKRMQGKDTLSPDNTLCS